MISGYSYRSFLCLVSTLVLVGLSQVASGAPLRIVQHLEPVTSTCQTVSSLGCSGSSTAETSGQLDTDYHAYVVLTDVDPQLGILGAEFGIYYGSGTASGLTIQSWTSCADLQTPGVSWPDAGSGIQLGFLSCRGTSADPADLEGESLVVLGYFTLSASSLDDLWVVPRFDTGYTPLTVTNCGLNTQYIDFTLTGVLGFGRGGNDPCSGHLDRFPSGCCLEGGCQGNMDSLYCDFLGGYRLIDFEHPYGCTSDGDCLAPVAPTTWGRIKATYD